MQISLVSAMPFWNVSYFYGCLKDHCVLKVCVKSITTFSRRILEFMQILNLLNIIIVTAHYCMRFNSCAYAEKICKKYGKLKKCVFTTYHAIHICKLARGWIYFVPFHARRSRLPVDHITNNANFVGFTSKGNKFGAQIILYFCWWSKQISKLSLHFESLFFVSEWSNYIIRNKK